MTRRNNRDLRVPGGWVKNGDTWTAASIGPDASAILTRRRRRPGVSESVELPAAYVTEHLDLGYGLLGAEHVEPLLGVLRRCPRLRALDLEVRGAYVHGAVRAGDGDGNQRADIIDGKPGCAGSEPMTVETNQ